MLTLLQPRDLSVTLPTDSARMDGRPFVQRKLSDLRGCFHNTRAFDEALSAGDPVIYEVTAVEPAGGEGQLHYGLGILYPGKIGDEFFLTKGHYHSFRPAAEVYVGLRGEGMMLLEDGEECRMVPLTANSVVYVPGHTAHRTMNTGSEPLLYLGIYPSNAGHDYGALSERNFRMVVVERNGHPALIPRAST